jgi:hypothetical protein
VNQLRKDWEGLVQGACANAATTGLPSRGMIYMSPQLRDSRGNLDLSRIKPADPAWLTVAATGRSPEPKKEFDWS